MCGTGGLSAVIGIEILAAGSTAGGAVLSSTGVETFGWNGGSAGLATAMVVAETWRIVDRSKWLRKFSMVAIMTGQHFLIGVWQQCNYRCSLWLGGHNHDFLYKR